MTSCESVDRNIINMSAMLIRLGIDPAEFARREAPALVGRCVAACQQCAASEPCRDWLARTGERIERAPAFCPNAARFEVVAAFTK